MSAPTTSRKARTTGQQPAGSTEPDQATDAAELTPLGATLRTALDGPFHERRERFRTELDGPALLRPADQSIEEARAWVNEALRSLVELGHGGVGFPTSVGGDGSLINSVLSFEAMAHTDLSLTVKTGVHWGLFGGAVVNLGTEHHHRTYLPDVISVATPGCFAMTEVGHGSDVQSLQTTLTYDPATEEFVVHSPSESATKTYIGGAASDAQMAVVFGQLITADVNHGIHAILVPIRDQDGTPLPGVRPGDNGAKGGLAGVDNGTLHFTHVRVPRDMLLDRYGGVDPAGKYHSPIESDNRRFFTMLGTLVRGRICVAAGGGIAARRGLAIATRYATHRTQFTAEGHDGEVVLMDYLAHQRKLLPRLAKAYALGFAQNELIGTLDRVQSVPSPDRDPRAQRELETRAAGIKAVTTDFANATLQVCREACGGAGYMAENQITLLRSDADVFATFEGDNTVLLQLVAKGLLTDYREMWGDLDMLGMVQAAVRTFSSAVIERTAARPLIERLVSAAGSEKEQLLSRGWHVSMFEEREKHVLESLAGRLRTAAKQEGDDAFRAFNLTQDHVLFAARAHMDRVILEAFIAGIEECQDEEATATLERLCDLYALDSIAADRGWYQEHNRMSASRAKALVPAINRLCQQLRPDALALVEGLGVPASWLGAPIAQP